MLNSGNLINRKRMKGKGRKPKRKRKTLGKHKLSWIGKRIPDTSKSNKRITKLVQSVACFKHNGRKKKITKEILTGRNLC